VKLPFDPPIEPMLAKPANALPEGDGWLFEPKWDGFRAIVFRDGDETYIQSRDLKPLNRYFPELEAPIKASVPKRSILDGEVVIAGDGGPPVRGAPAAHPSRRVEGPDARGAVASLVRRLGPARVGRRRPPSDAAGGAPSPGWSASSRGTLDPAVHLTPAPRPIVRSPSTGSTGSRARASTGVIAKRLDGTYQPGKRAMIKVKHQRTADCAVAGFRWHKNGPGTHIGSLLLGLFDEAGTVHSVGVTSSFTWDKRAALAKELEPLA
jgi:hypothetical protein